MLCSRVAIATDFAGKQSGWTIFSLSISGIAMNSRSASCGSGSHAGSAASAKQVEPP